MTARKPLVIGVNGREGLIVSGDNLALAGGLTVGGSAQLVVGSTGNITKINNVTTSWPSSQGAASSVMKNDGSGNLSWGSVSGSSILVWGSISVSSTTATRYLTPGYDSSLAPLDAVSIKAPYAFTARNLYIYVRTTAASANPVVYTVRKNGVATALTVSLNANVQTGSDTTHSVSFAAGDLIDIEVTKTFSIGASPADIMASFECSGT